MKRILTLGSILLMLALVTVLGAQRHQGEGGNHNPPNQYHNNHNYQNELREFRGFLVVNERDIKHNARLGFHINLSPLQIDHIDFTAGRRLRDSYGIIVKKPGGGHAYYRLDKKGRQIAQRMFDRQRHDNRQIYVEVRGKLERNSRTIDVKSMERIRNNNGRNHGWDDNGPNHRG